MEDFCNWQDNAAYRRFIEETAIAPAAARLMQSRQVRLFHDHMLDSRPSAPCLGFMNDHHRHCG